MLKKTQCFVFLGRVLPVLWSERSIHLLVCVNSFFDERTQLIFGSFFSNHWCLLVYCRTAKQLKKCYRANPTSFFSRCYILRHQVIIPIFRDGLCKALIFAAKEISSNASLHPTCRITLISWCSRCLQVTFPLFFAVDGRQLLDNPIIEKCINCAKVTHLTVASNAKKLMK